MKPVLQLRAALDSHLKRLGPLVDCCRSRGQRLAIVGGAVRDALLGREVQDLDLVVEGDARQLVAEVTSKHGGSLRAHAAFGTATWIRPDGRIVDLASSRSETYTKPGALPEVQPSSLEEDLGRRDFSVNAIALLLGASPHEPLLDLHRGQEDLKAGRIRVLHSRSFIDDPTRIWRALRFASRLGMKLEEATDRELRDAVRGRGLESISKERLGAEIHKAFGEGRRADLIVMGLQRGLWTSLSTDLDGNDLLELRGLPGGPELAWLGLSATLSESERQRLVALVPGGARAQQQWCRGDLRVQQALSSTHLSDGSSLRSQIGRVLDRLVDVELDLLAARADPTQLSWVQWWKEEGQAIESGVDGQTLQDMGFPEGPAIGQAKKAALDAARDGAPEAQQLVIARAVASGEE